MNSEEIDKRLQAIGRPSFERYTDVLVRSLVADMRQRQAAWDEANPALAAERLVLLAELDELQSATERAARLAIDASQSLEAVRKLAGDRALEGAVHALAEKPRRVAQDWWPTQSWCLALIGGVGVGKTSAAAWVALQAIREHKSLRWLNCAEASLRPLFGLEADERARREREVDVVVLDEIGAGLSTAGWKSWLEALVISRHARGRRTVLTSNADLPTVRALLGDRIIDRLKEGVAYDSFGPSLRKQPRKSNRDEVPF